MSMDGKITTPGEVKTGEWAGILIADNDVSRVYFKNGILVECINLFGSLSVGEKIQIKKISEKIIELSGKNVELTGDIE